MDNNTAENAVDNETVYNKVVGWLFETHAIRVAPPDKPFWYTSGTIGPYYSNTHFLYGGEKEANALLEVIDREKGDKLKCPGIVLDETKSNYERNSLYHQLIDEMVNFIRNHMRVDEIDYISCGERRDWFFGPLIAELLGKPCLFIYKDLSVAAVEDGSTDMLKDKAALAGKKILHIADLITEASSYTRAWIPAVRALGGQIVGSLVVVDRNQGGGEILRGEGIQSFAMAAFDEALFQNALAQGYITREQYRQVMDYIRDPKAAMQKFLKDYPEFLNEALHSGDEKVRQRARLLLEQQAKA